MLVNSGNKGKGHKEEKKAQIENDNKDREAISFKNVLPKIF